MPRKEGRATKTTGYLTSHFLSQRDVSTFYVVEPTQERLGWNAGAGHLPIHHAGQRVSGLTSLLCVDGPPLDSLSSNKPPLISFHVCLHAGVMIQQ